MPELIIYDDIGGNFYDEGVTAKNVQAQLADFEGDLTVRINSYGGDVFEGHAIYSLIKNYPGEKTVYIDGIAASAASVIAMAGDKVVMPINAMLMIHDPWTFSIGNSAELKKTAETLDQIKETIVNVYHKKTGMDKSQLSDMMTAETWLDYDVASEFNFAEKDEEKQVVLNFASKQWINKLPEQPEKQPDTEQAIEVLNEYPNSNARQRYLEIMADAI